MRTFDKTNYLGITFYGAKTGYQYTFSTENCNTLVISTTYKYFVNIKDYRDKFQVDIGVQNFVKMVEKDLNDNDNVKKRATMILEIAHSIIDFEKITLKKD